MRLMLLVPSLRAGGAERVLSTMANYWASAGNEIAIVTLAPAREAPFYALDPAIHYIALDQTGPSASALQAIERNWARIRAVRRAIQAAQPDALISFIDEMNLLVLISAFGLGIPTIVSERNNPRHHRMGRVRELLRRVLYRRAARVVVQTEDVTSFFSAPIRARTCVIPNPVRSPLSGRRAALARREQHTLVAFGRLVEQKGFDVLLRAFARVAPQHPSWSLTIWGEGKERAALEGLAQELGLGDRARLPGVTPDPFGEMARADLFALTSRYEGFPNVLCEAMACGLPVVSFDCPSGPRDIIRDGIDGVLVPPGDEAGLAAALGRLMGDAAERTRLALRAPDVLERFGLEQVMAQWNALLAEVLPAAQGQRAPDLQRESLP